MGLDDRRHPRPMGKQHKDGRMASLDDLTCIFGDLLCLRVLATSRHF